MNFWLVHFIDFVSDLGITQNFVENFNLKLMCWCLILIWNMHWRTFILENLTKKWHFLKGWVKPERTKIQSETRMNPTRGTRKSETRKLINPKMYRAGSVLKSEIRKSENPNPNNPNPTKSDPCSPLIFPTISNARFSYFTL